MYRMHVPEKLNVIAMIARPRSRLSKHHVILYLLVHVPRTMEPNGTLLPDPGLVPAPSWSTFLGGLYEASYYLLPYFSVSPLRSHFYFSPFLREAE